MDKIGKLALALCVACIAMPLSLLALWSVASRWPWPEILPEGYTLRGIEEIFSSGAVSLRVIGSSIAFSGLVALAAVVVGAMAARALVFYDFVGKELLQFGSILPIIVPTTVFAMGIHILLIRIGLSDTVLGVFLVHLISSLPYPVKLLTDSARATGKKLEEQARVLGAGPLYAYFMVSLPGMAPSVAVSLSMAYIVSFSQYFLTLIVGGGSFQSLAVIMVPFLQNGDRTIASAYSLVFLAASLAVFGAFEWAGGRIGGGRPGKWDEMERQKQKERRKER